MTELFVIHSNTWNHLNMCQKKNRVQARLQMLSTKCVYKSYIFDKQYLSLNNLRWLICHKNSTKPNRSLGWCKYRYGIGISTRHWHNGSISGRVIPKTLKMVLGASLLNTQHYKVRIKGKVEKSWERSSALSYTLV